ncbi:fish-egg lectin-like [Myxocyprinus asiaticus]|uniref:fish-egg lectin-like n=1 Tax=Myxocyprinus asiaticus TaxID=70543 RepID=UPI002223CB43|nr:fish-egg lectin-like [Myxocyprinus asiaticus]XP_051544879.1 fish-egg lectin-like [Myxocyprinus asiaticus]
MKAYQCILLLCSCQFLYTLAIECEVISGTLKQIDAGIGLVGGVNDANEVFLLIGNSFIRINASLKHFSVGPAGELGVNSANILFKFQNGNFRQISAVFKQVDAGGDQIIAGVSPVDDVFCLNKEANNNGPSDNFILTKLPGKLKYYSCGPYSCWGVNSFSNVVLIKNVTGNNCGGSGIFDIINGTLSMVEVGTDGSVYGVDTLGTLMQRNNVSSSNPAGSSWTSIVVCPNGHKHVSFDLGRLWVVCSDGSIRRCI